MSIDAETFRQVLGAVPTAVTVLTIVDPSGADRAMTVGAFASLSLDPPLVLACIGNDAMLAGAMRSATRFGVSVLADDQEPMSRRFAARTLRDVAASECLRGPAGSALLDGASAHIECRIVARHPGGDHTIVVGEIEYAAAFERPPLVHHRGTYSRLAT
ncbi:MAG: flavin reductase family protein [Gemmatimonadetes bacterium]|nr:flavin reductase family protein [Gemmatimonadota bacterium]